MMLEEAQIPVIVTKNFNAISYVIGCHPYQTFSMPFTGEWLLSERKPENWKKNIKLLVTFNLENKLGLLIRYFISSELTSSFPTKLL